MSHPGRTAIDDAAVRVVLLGNDAIAAVAPASPVQLMHACRAVGFGLVVPPNWGDELVAMEALRQLDGLGRQPAVLVVCPHVAARVESVPGGPDLALVSIVSPPVAAARHLRRLGGDVTMHITYVGGCPDAANDASIDQRMLPDEFITQLAARGVVVAEQPELFEDVLPPDRRRWVSLPGGVPMPAAVARRGGHSLLELDGAHAEAAARWRSMVRGAGVVDAAAGLGCACSGALPGRGGISARARVVSSDPPRARGAVIAELPGLNLERRVTLQRAVARTSPPRSVAAVEEASSPSPVPAPSSPKWSSSPTRAATDSPVGDRPLVEAPREAPREASREASREAPRGGPAAEASPRFERPVSDSPVVSSPVVDAPVVAPTFVAPTFVAPTVVEYPAADAPMTDPPPASAPDADERPWATSRIVLPDIPPRLVPPPEPRRSLRDPLSTRVQVSVMAVTIAAVALLARWTRPDASAASAGTSDAPVGVSAPAATPLASTPSGSATPTTRQAARAEPRVRSTEPTVATPQRRSATRTAGPGDAGTPERVPARASRFEAVSAPLQQPPAATTPTTPPTLPPTSAPAESTVARPAVPSPAPIDSAALEREAIRRELEQRRARLDSIQRRIDSLSRLRRPPE